MSGPAYAALKARSARLYDLGHLQAIASWDRMTQMPPGGAAARGRAQGALARLMHELEVDPALDALLAEADSEALEEDDARNLALMRHARARASALPDALVERRSHLAAAAGPAWARAKAEGRWDVFAEALAPLLACVREEAQRLGDRLGLSPYDALIDGFDRGLRFERIGALFSEVAAWLPALIATTRARQAREPAPAPLAGPFAADGQRAACRAAMAALGFDFAAGRLDESAHPFTGGAPEDVRVTTRLSPDDCLPALMGVIHETGHGRYQAGLPAAWRGQLLGEPCGASIHEAQALALERQVAPTHAFLRRLSAILEETLGAQPAFAPEALRARITRVRPGAIRVDADALTYPAHVILRVEIEAALIAGEMSVDEVPQAWSVSMARLLDVEVDGAGAQGALQDIHWSQGMFGYFPAYLVGAMAAAQFAEAFRRGRGDADIAAEPNDLDGFDAWLAEHVWSQGARHGAEALVRRATGVELSCGPLRTHLEARYLA